MNPYLFNSKGLRHLIKPIANELNVNIKNIYKEIIDIQPNGDIITKDSRKFKIKLEEYV